VVGAIASNFLFTGIVQHTGRPKRVNQIAIAHAKPQAHKQAHKVDVRQTRTQVTIALKQACDRADINIPYPICTLYYYNQQQFNDTSPVSDGAQKS
jgi:small-conductance mechanosensitive channel